MEKLFIRSETRCKYLIHILFDTMDIKWTSITEETFLKRGGRNSRKQVEQFVFRRISTVKIDPPIDHVRRVSILQRVNGHSE